MRICVFGAGAVGGLIASALAGSEHEISVIARGANLAAIREHGLRVRRSSNAETVTVRLAAEESPDVLGPQEFVIVAVKAHSLGEVATRIGPLLGPNTKVVTALNGIPWWFPYALRRSGPLERLQTLDPDGVVDRAVPVDRVIGCVVYMAASTPEPGVVSHNSGNRLVLGAPGGDTDPATELLVRLLAQAGFDTQLSPSIHKEYWAKLLGNICFNPASALTLATSVRMIEDPAMHSFLVHLMNEVLAIGRGLGMDLDIDPEKRIQTARQLGHSKTSMLQDLEAGKPLEIDGLLSATLELARNAGVDAPLTEGLLGLTRLRARSTGQYRN